MLFLFLFCLFCLFLEQGKVYCRAMQGDEVAHALKSLKLPKSLGMTFLKGGGGGGGGEGRSCRVHGLLAHSPPNGR